MLLEKIISYIGLLGVGSLAGITIKYFLDRKENQRKLLFEARVKAYAGLIGRLFNLFNELDLNTLPEAVRVSKINHILSETYLVGSNQLVELFGELKPKLFSFHNHLDAWVKDKSIDEAAGEKLHAELLILIGKIHNQMREDLFISSRIYQNEINNAAKLEKKI